MMKDNKYFYFIGIDVSKKTLDVSVHQGKKHLESLRVENTKLGLKKMMNSLKGLKIDLEKT